MHLDRSWRRGRRGTICTVGLATLATLLIPPTALAQWDDDEPGFYYEGGTYFNVGVNYIAEDTKGTIGQRSKGKGFQELDGDAKDASGFNAVFGKRPWEYLSVEIQFEYADGFQFTNTEGEDFDLKVYTASLNGKIFAFHDLLKNFNEGRLQPHLLGGFGLMVSRDLDIDTGAAMMFRAGGGLDYYFSERWAINLRSEYVTPVGLLKGLRYVTSSVGLSYQLE